LISRSAWRVGVAGSEFLTEVENTANDVGGERPVILSNKDELHAADVTKLVFG
jgi:hypothetical protein